MILQIQLNESLYKRKIKVCSRIFASSKEKKFELIEQAIFVDRGNSNYCKICQQKKLFEKEENMTSKSNSLNQHTTNKNDETFSACTDVYLANEEKKTKMLKNDLVVTGTQCKLHRSNSMAIYLDAGKHLITDSRYVSYDAIHDVFDYDSCSQDIVRKSIENEDAEKSGEVVGANINRDRTTMDQHDVRLLLHPLEYEFRAQNDSNNASCDKSITELSNYVKDGKYEVMQKLNKHTATFEMEMPTKKEEIELNFERFGLLPQHNNYLGVCNPHYINSNISTTKTELKVSKSESVCDHYSQKIEGKKKETSMSNLSFTREDDALFLCLANEKIILVSHSCLWILKQIRKYPISRKIIDSDFLV